MGKAVLSFFVGAGATLPIIIAVPPLGILAPVTGAIAAARSTAKPKNKSWFAEIQIVAAGHQTEHIALQNIGEAEHLAGIINNFTDTEETSFLSE